MASPFPTPAPTLSDSNFSSPLFSSPVEAPPSRLDVPTPSSSDLGTVTGILILDGDQEKPVTGAILYLGEILRLDDGTPASASLDKQTAPVTQTNAAGQFIFGDVPAGQYTLLLDLVSSTFLLYSPTGSDLLIQVKGGQVVDLGELRYSDLPVPSTSPPPN